MNNLEQSYKKILEVLSTMTGKDYVEINMSKEEWFKFKDSIPNL